MRAPTSLALGLALAVALAACSRPAAPPAGQPGAPQPGAPQPGAQPAPPPGTQSQAAGPAALPAGATRYAIVSADSEAAYIAREKFVNRTLPNEAVGTTSAVRGELVLGQDGQFLTSVVTVDLRTLKSDQARRDERLRAQWLEADKFPLAEFTVAGAEGGPPRWAPDQPVAFRLAGKLKVHGVERPVSWDASATRSGDTLRLEATLAIKMSDFGIEPPDIAGMLKAEDALKLQVKLAAKKQ